MILILTELFNKTDENFIKIYEENIVNCFHKLIQKRSYCHSAEIVGNGYYSRCLFYNDTINYVDIYRVKCKNCGKSVLMVPAKGFEPSTYALRVRCSTT